MTTLVVIGFLGGLITGISPCILPILPVVLLSAVTGNHTDKHPVGHPTPAGAPKRAAGQSLRPYVVIAGLIVSFSVFTLIGSTVLTLLHLPQDAVRVMGLIALVLIGLGLISPRIQHLLELIRQWRASTETTHPIWINRARRPHRMMYRSPQGSR